MRKKIGVLLSVFLAIIAFFAFVGCNYNGKKSSRENMTLFLFQDNEIEGEEMEMIQSCPVYRDKITRIHLPYRHLTTGKGKYFYLFYDGEYFENTSGGIRGRELQVLAAYDDVGKHEIVCRFTGQPYRFVAWVFIEGDNSVTLNNYGDVRYEFDSCGAIEETDVENYHPKGKRFVYKYDGKTHYPKIKVFYKNKELPCHVDVKARTNGEIGWEQGYHNAEGYVVNVDSYEINYYVYVDEEYIQAESLIRTVFGEGIVENIFVDIVE